MTFKFVNLLELHPLVFKFSGSSRSFSFSWGQQAESGRLASSRNLNLNSEKSLLRDSVSRAKICCSYFCRKTDIISSQKINIGNRNSPFAFLKKVRVTCNLSLHRLSFFRGTDFVRDSYKDFSIAFQTKRLNNVIILLANWFLLDVRYPVEILPSPLMFFPR